MPAVSVVIPAFNHRDFILQSIGSVFAQTFSDFEVIVINDGSPDDTEKLVRSLVDARRIRYFEQANRGQAAARNRGAAEARGEFLAFLDDDDYWPIDKLEWQAAGMREDHSLAALGGTVVRVSTTGEFILTWGGPTRWVQRKDLFRGNAFESPGQVLYRAKLFQDCGGFDERIWGADDHDLLFRLSEHGRVKVENRVALYYRVHGANASLQRARHLQNIVHVLEKNFRRSDPDFKQYSKTSYVWAYVCFGRGTFAQAKDRLLDGKLGAMKDILIAISVFAKPALTTPPLMLRMISDLIRSSLPRWFKHFVKRRLGGRRAVGGVS